MANQFDRRRISVNGLGVLEVRETDPSAATSFSSVGALQDVVVNDEHTMVEVMSDHGKLLNLLSSERKVSGTANLWQTSKEEVDLLSGAVAKLHAVRYGGMATTGTFQYWCFPECRLSPAVSLEYKVGGRVMPMLFAALNQQGLGYTVPEYYLLERAGTLRMSNLVFWVDAREALNLDTVKFLDASGFEQHGTIAPSGDVATIWNDSTSTYFLRFDGVDQYVDHGDVLDDDGTSDFLMECWVRVQAADGTLQEVFSKQTAAASAGFSLVRNASNQLAFELGDGAGGNVTVNNTTTTLQNVWRHFAVAVDRNGNMTPYLNGSAQGSAASVASEGTGTNSVNFYIGRRGSAYGQVDVGGLRKYVFGAGGLPSDIATIISNHYNAEAAYYGL